MKFFKNFVSMSWPLSSNDPQSRSSSPTVIAAELVFCAHRGGSVVARLPASDASAERITAAPRVSGCAEDGAGQERTHPGRSDAARAAQVPVRCVNCIYGIWLIIWLLNVKGFKKLKIAIIRVGGIGIPADLPKSIMMPNLQGSESGSGSRFKVKCAQF